MARLSILIDSGYLINSARKTLSSAPSNSQPLEVDLDGLHRHMVELAGEIAPKASLDRLRWYSGYNGRRGFSRKQISIKQHPEYFGIFLANYEDGTQKGIDSAITADLMEMGLEESISDIVLLSGDSDFLTGLTKAKQFGRLRGLRVFVLGIESPTGEDSISRELMSEAYGIFWWDAAKISQFITINDPSLAQLSDKSQQPMVSLPLESNPVAATDSMIGFNDEQAVDDLDLTRQDLAGFDHPSARHTTIDFDGEPSEQIPVELEDSDQEPAESDQLSQPPIALDQLENLTTETSGQSESITLADEFLPSISANGNMGLPDTVAIRGAIKSYAATQSFRFAVAEDGGTDVYLSPKLVVDAELTNMAEGTGLILQVVKGQVITSVAAATEVEITLGSDPQSGVHFGTILPFERHHTSRKVLGDNGTEYWIGRRLLRDAKLSHLGEGSRLVFELGPSREAVAVSLDSNPETPAIESAGAIAEIPENQNFIQALEFYRSSDYEQAEAHYRLAAQQGHSEALKALGFMYHYGQGLRASPFLAYLFAQLANRFAGEVPIWIPRSFMVGLDAEQIEYAEEFASRWQVGMELPEG